MRLEYERGLVSGCEGPGMNAAADDLKKKKKRVRGLNKGMSGDGFEVKEESLTRERRYGNGARHCNGIEF